MDNSKPLLIAVDMDGTLLNDEKEICPKTLSYLRKLTKQGHKVILSSGRPFRALKRYYDTLKLDTPLICYNGSRAISLTDKNFKTFSVSLKKEELFDVLKDIKSGISSIMCETDDEIWINQEDDFLGIFFPYADMNIHKGNIEDILDKDPYTCVCKTTFEYRETEEFKKAMEKLKDSYYIYWIGSPYFEFHGVNTNKGAAVKYIADYYKIPKENIISFGDSTNDIEMFDESGTSVLMCNSKKEIKNATRISKKDNNHDGIYYELKEIIEQY